MRSGLPGRDGGRERGRRPSRRAGWPELFAALQGDCHSHSDWSDGGSPIDEMARRPGDLGHDYLALTDHTPRLTVAHGLAPSASGDQLDVVAEVNESWPPSGS